MSAPQRAAAMVLTPVCRPATQSSQMAVAYRGKARNCFSVSIHGPGLGIIARAAPL